MDKSGWKNDGTGRRVQLAVGVTGGKRRGYWEGRNWTVRISKHAVV